VKRRFIFVPEAQPILSKDSASRVECKIKRRETTFYFQSRGAAFSNLLIYRRLRMRLQKTVFCLVKGHLLQGERRPFAARFAVFCKTGSLVVPSACLLPSLLLIETEASPVRHF